MKTVIKNLLRPQPASPNFAEFFAERENRVRAIADFDHQLAEVNRQIDELISTPPDRKKPAQLGALRSTLDATEELRTRAINDLAQHDRGFERAANELVRAVKAAREACLEEIAGLVADHLAVLFLKESDLGPNERMERRQNIEGIVPRTIHHRKELSRHFPIWTVADVGGPAKLLPFLRTYQDEVAACQSRLTAIREMRAGTRPITADLAEFEHADSKPKEGKAVSEKYDPPESESAFAARRREAIKQFEHVASAIRTSEGLTKAELEEGGRIIHPDRDPRFKRRMGTPA